MNKEIKEWIIIGAGVLGIWVLFSLGMDHEKTKCLANGGKWVSGIVAGQYSALCIPN
jgi:Zn-dependent protease